MTRAGKPSMTLEDALHEMRLYQDLIGLLSLHFDWRTITQHMPADECEVFADAVDAWRVRIHHGRPGEPPTVERWWRAPGGRDKSSTPQTSD